ncbi:hypothetical protein ACEWY4_005098 [Coilia grayii]|uniref:E3 ubiquitin-protein ligase UBR3 n=1 Tax=Coilia grayii TaxID=363190 RepID=A0ABD1KHR7_9TELE
MLSGKPALPCSAPGNGEVCRHTCLPICTLISTINRDCATGPNYVLCADCFQNSIHTRHRYQMVVSGGGFCDCGDVSAWKAGPCCSTHSPGAAILTQLLVAQTTIPNTPLCGRNFMIGEMMYSCWDCARDPSYVLCADCFQNSIHRSHRYRTVIAAALGGFCDCGDVSAWKAGPCCSTHSPGATILTRLLVAQTTIPNTRLCGRRFMIGEMVYTCRDCAADANVLLCADCLLSGIHQHHHFEGRVCSGLGWFCDCGDLKAWRTGPCCSKHTSTTSTPQSPPSAPTSSTTTLRTNKTNTSLSTNTAKTNTSLPVSLSTNTAKTPNSLSTTTAKTPTSSSASLVINTANKRTSCSTNTAKTNTSLSDNTTRTPTSLSTNTTKTSTCLSTNTAKTFTSSPAFLPSTAAQSQTSSPKPNPLPRTTARMSNLRVTETSPPPSSSSSSSSSSSAESDKKPLTSLFKASGKADMSAQPRCGRVSKEGHTIYSCRDCVLDPTCVLCQDCFQNSTHSSHNFKKRVSNGGTACNCGEVDVWRSAPYCSQHAPTTSAPAGREPPSTSSWQEVPLHQQPKASITGATVTMNEPICLINTGRDESMSVQQGALQILEQIQQPVVVVAVVGLYRTGKSYLMNRLAGRQRGFALGGSIESKTKGIWMWCVPHPFKDGHTLVLLDTEGLGDVEKGDDKHDTWIFCLALLLSSTLVYNSLGTIDNIALEKLQFVTELTEHIRVKSSDHSRKTELMCIFPSFVWTVRDFTLELALNGKPITADDYLENSLKLKSGPSPEVTRRDLVRRSLREFFAVRRCFVMDRPASAEKMKRMEQLTDADLEPSFVQQAQQFCSYIHQQAPAKTMRGGRGLTGRMLGSLAETYVEAIRSGKVPCLESAVESLAKIHNSRAVAEALEFYRAEMTQKVQFPTETQEALSGVHTSAEKQAISIFINASFNDQEQEHQLKLKVDFHLQMLEKK